ncbi:hypothetical protein ABH926_008864 [Catenulispora sp. GP43]|uniref:hypothetical protein n=1 Tax=Catenulispora sp. GP43 TaxID=3156263 RepID=UPI003517AFB4
MSQDDQRNQPNEEPEQAARRAEADAAGGAGASPGSGPEPEPAPGPTPAADAPKPTVTGTPAPTVVGAPSPASELGAAAVGPTVATAAGAAGVAATPRAVPRRREFHEAGEGAARYAEAPESMPRSGSEESWSAQPHPGFRPDPARRASPRRLMVSSLVGLIVLGAGSFAGYLVLTAKSSNGNGPALWTGAVEQHGAVVGGINAQNNDAASPVDLPAGASFGNSGTSQGAAINQAIMACQKASTTSVPVTGATGTAAEISAWGNKATPTANDLHAGAATLQRTLAGTDAITVANAAYNLCLGYPAVATVPPMPDAAGSQAWSAAVKAYAQAANQALQGISGKPNMLVTANDSINAGNADLAALSARVNASV